MNRRTYFLLTLLLLCMPALAQDKMDAMVNRLKAFGAKIPQEQVFLHLDNSSYYLGDTIFYKAYVGRTDNGSPTNLSGILYCELLNNDGYLVERQMIALENGEGHGNFALTDTVLYAGYYELRAYTKWQLNWGITEQAHSRWTSDYFFNKDMVNDFYRDYEKLYSRVFPVYDAPRTPGDFSQDMSLRPLSEYHKASNEKKTIVEFFPEARHFGGRAETARGLGGPRCQRPGAGGHPDGDTARRRWLHHHVGDREPRAGRIRDRSATRHSPHGPLHPHKGRPHHQSRWHPRGKSAPATCCQERRGPAHGC